MDSETARIAILSGAQYIVSPYFSLETAKLCNRYRVPYMPGCATITEVITAMEAGADYIKTSTGKDAVASLYNAYVMCRAIYDFNEKTGVKVGFKAAGGIISTQDALLYLTIVKGVLGEDWVNTTDFRIGASRLANNILSAVSKEEVKYF
jgi:2-keto-3-deoxy-6-phosphogluconate aldolase